jgi:hypothetical protein
MSMRLPKRGHVSLFAFFLPLIIIAVTTAGARPIKPQPCLVVAAEDFGQVRIGRESAAGLEIFNRCNSAVTIRKAKASPSQFRADLPAGFRIAAGTSRSLPVFFKPVDASTVTGKFILHSSDRRFPWIAVSATGTGVLAPSIAVNPASLSREMAPGVLDTVKLSVANGGGSRVEAIVSAKGAPIPRPDRGWRVLFLNTVITGPWEDDFYRNLRTLDNVDTAEPWDATRSLPTLNRLLEYDVVVAASANPWVDAAGAGDLLAAYIEAGGKVCLMATALGENTNPLAGRIQDYFPISSTQLTFGGDSGPMAVHPITEGVRPFYSESVLGARSTPGQGQGIPLGTYESGYLLGAYHPLKPVVALNIGLTNLSGDVYRLVSNTLDFLGTSPSWMTPRPPIDNAIFVVDAGQTRDLNVVFSSHRLPAGTYQGYIEFLHDAEEGPNPLQVPVVLRVTSAGRLAVEPDSIDFGKAWIGGSGRAPLRIGNIGNAPVRISAFETGLPSFSVTAALPLEIPAFSYATVEAVYAPASEGRDGTSLIVRSDAGNDPIETVLIGEATSAPALSYSPDRLEATVAEGQTAMRSLKLRNDGGDSIKATLRPVTDAGAGSPGTGPERLNVLYLQTLSSPEYTSDFMWNLQSLENVASLSNYPAFESTPTLEYLKRFDVVLVAAADAWADPVAVGDVLADYVDAGGRVCLMHVSLSTYPGRGLGGRITTPEYAPVAPGGNGGTGYFGSLEDHPIMEGITPELSSNAVMAVTEPLGSAVSLGRYDNGNLIGAVNTLKPVVFINIHPWDGDHTWQTIPLLGNAFSYLSGFHTWLLPQTLRVELAPGEEIQIPIAMGTAYGPGPGTHSGRLEIAHNSPGSSSPIVIPAALTVEAAPGGTPTTVAGEAP